MKNYEKPRIVILDNEPEGIYMASGNKLNIPEFIVEQNWITGGIVSCVLNLSGISLDNLTLYFNFNTDIVDAWIDGGTQTIAGSTASINFYSAPISAKLYVNMNSGDINQLKIIDAYYKN